MDIQKLFTNIAYSYILRLLQMGTLWLTANGVLTESNGGKLAIAGATLLVALLQTVISKKLAKWRINLSTWLGGMNYETVKEVADTVPFTTKVAQSFTKPTDPNPNPEN